MKTIKEVKRIEGGRNPISWPSVIPVALRDASDDSYMKGPTRAGFV